MKNIFLIIVIGVLFLSSTYNNTVQVADIAVNTDYHFCKIISSSADKEFLLLDTNVWHSSKIAKDDLILFIFQEPIFVNKIKIAEASELLKTCRVYSNNGIIGDFAPENIDVNQKIVFLAIKFQKVDGFQLSDAYTETAEYHIAFEKLNSSVSLRQIKFFSNDSTEINLISIRKNNDKTVFKLNNKKIIDYSVAENSICIKNNNEVVACSGDNLFYGYAKNETVNSANIFLKKVVFDSGKLSLEDFVSDLKFSDNILSIRDFADFMIDFRDDFFVDVKSIEPSVILDIRYATENNFMKKQVYDCPFCFLRYSVAKALMAAQQDFLKKGYCIKLFDCYRPHDVQYKLWEIVPNKNYVANPAKGSIHNRGGAVDLTITDSLGNELDMGTDFDFFGYKAFVINKDLPDTVLANRELLWSVMRKNGFRTIKTEWWHLSHALAMRYKISNVAFPCE